jgi:hypothetical protein
MVDRVFLELWQRRTRGDILDAESSAGFPIKRFDIARIRDGIVRTSNLPEPALRRVSAILSDLKFLLYSLETITDHFYTGPFKIVGNSDYEKANLNPLSFLQGNHYRVFLISITYERIMDFLELVHFGRALDAKRDRWGKQYARLSRVRGFNMVSPSEHAAMITFRNRVRRAEVHGLSNVFRQLDDTKWDHFQDEERLIEAVLLRISDEYR